MAGAYYDDPNFLYGNAARFYSDTPVDYDFNRLIWRFEVAWKGDQAFFAEDNGNTEGTTVIDCAWTRGRLNWIDYSANGLSMFDPGHMVITLTDLTDRYNPYNTTSPLYGFVGTGKICRLYVRLNSAVTHLDRFSGIVQDIHNNIDDKGQPYIEIEVQDGWSLLQETQVFLPTVANANPKPSMLNVLNVVDWPELWNASLDDGPALLPYFWAGGENARAILHNIAYTTASKVFITGDGKLNYQRRTNPEPAAVASFTQNDMGKDIKTNSPWENQLNIVEMLAKSILSYSTLGTMWGDTIQFNPLVELGSRQIPEFSIASESYITLSGSYAFPTNLSFPTDARILFGYSTNIQDTKLIFQFTTLLSNGLTTDITSYIAVEVFNDGGDGFQVRLRNNYPGIAKLTRIAVANTVYAYIDRASVVFSKTSVAIPRFLKKFTVSTPYLLNAAPLAPTINSILNWYYTRVTTQSVTPRFSLERQPELQFVDIMDVIHVNVVQKNIDGYFRVGYLEERWLSPTGQSVSTMIHTEPSS